MRVYIVRNSIHWCFFSVPNQTNEPLYLVRKFRIFNSIDFLIAPCCVRMKCGKEFIADQLDKKVEMTWCVIRSRSECIF